MRHLSFVGLFALALAAPAQAENAPYFGFKAGFMDADAGGHDNPFNAGGVFGYRFFEDATGSGAVEGEGTITLKDGELQGGGDWDIATIGVYFAYRTAGEVYLKGKAGFAQQNIGGTGAVPDDTGLSFGFGVGWKPTRKAGVELEFTLFDDVDFLSIGFFTNF
ncbi:MAG TPA: outer membrane beta-barrel protein [Burkholderiaceae bacterium]|nr:outer membrane beta-barrel protein [Burkholderiaceae bacterium]